MATTDLERFNKRVHGAPNGCHLWTGAIDEDGYGTFNVNGTKIGAHVYAYGDVPEGHELDHQCHNADLACPGDATCMHRRCVNRDHLEAVTHTVNLQRRHERAAMLTRTATTTAVMHQADSTKPESTTAKRTRGRPFVPGDPRRNNKGRPRKGESFAERYRKEVERAAPALVAAHVDRAMGSGVVAERAFSLAAAYVMGRPVQPYVNMGADDPLASLFAEIAAATAPQLASPADITTAAERPTT